MCYKMIPGERNTIWFDSILNIDPQGHWYVKVCLKILTSGSVLIYF